MTLVRTLLALVVGLLVALATTAFSIQQTLTEPAAFVASMEAAARTPAVEGELRAEIREEVLEALDRVAPDGPLAVALAAVGRDAIADAAADATGTDVFRTAWHDWSLLLFTGLADRARGTPNAQVTVSRHQVTMAVAPLITPILGDTIAGSVAGALDLFDAESTVTIDAGFPIGPALTAAGRLAGWRWALVAGAAGGLLLLLAASHRRPWLWLALTSVVAGLCCALGGAAVQLVQSQPPPGADHPQLGLALTIALTQHWDANLIRMAVLCGAVAVLAFLLDAIIWRRRRPVRTVLGPASP